MGMSFHTGGLHLQAKGGRLVRDSPAPSGGSTRRVGTNMAAIPLDKSGKRIGNVVLLDMLPGKASRCKSDKSMMWRCICDCGTHFERTHKELARALRKGKQAVCSLQCPILAERHRQQKQEKMLANGNDSQFPKVFNVYRKRGNTTGKGFSLRTEEFDSLIQQYCFYCGNPPPVKGRNGIDRIDSRQGYHIKNVVPCCHRCNSMKMATTRTEFLNACKQIAMRHFGLMEEVKPGKGI